MIPAEVRKRLDHTRSALLDFHTALLDEEKARYELHAGPIGSAGRYLQLVIHDPWFAWLHPITELVVQIDELSAAKQPPAAGAGEALLHQARQLLSPSEAGDDFQRRLHEAIQRAPGLVLAHAAAVRAAARTD